jgi:hypothetical protein
MQGTSKRSSGQTSTGRRVLIGDGSKCLRFFDLAVGNFPVWSRRLTPVRRNLGAVLPGAVCGAEVTPLGGGVLPTALNVGLTFETNQRLQ